MVLATKNNIGFVFDIEYLKNKTIAVGKNYTAAKLMLKKFPYMNYVYAKNIDEALNMVKEGKVFGAVDILPVIAYKLNKFDFENLKISGQIPIDFQVRFMLSKKYEYLLPKINEAIDRISYKEKQKIYEKYINADGKYVFSSKEIIFYFLIFTSIVIIILLWVYTLIYELRELKNKKFDDYYLVCDRLTGIYNKQSVMVNIEKN